MQKHTAASIGKTIHPEKTTSVASKNKALASLKVNIGSFIKVGGNNLYCIHQVPHALG